MDNQPTTNNSPPTTSTHTIRLRHPWQCETDADQVVWSRKFNWPAELSPDEVVELVVENVSTSAAISLNRSSLSSETDGRFDVTTLLSEHNHLDISADADVGEPSGKCPYDVRLEIVSSEP